MNPVWKFLKTFDEKRALFYTVGTGYLVSAVDSLWHNRYYEAAGTIGIGAACALFAVLAGKTEGLEDRL